MKWKILLMSGLIVGFTFSDLQADEDSFYLKKLLIKGNSVTKEKYIRSFITLEEEKIYELDDIINEINISRENLEKTNLFSGIFFNDEFDEENNLTITVQLKEKNYLLFGPTGYITYENDKFYIDSGLYIKYNNLFGNAALVVIEVPLEVNPLYKAAGISFFHQNLIGRIRYTCAFEYRYFLNEQTDWLEVVPGVAWKIRDRLFSGINFKLNWNSFNTFMICPYIEGGNNERYSFKTKHWFYYTISPFYGINAGAPPLYGLSSKLNLYRDLFFKIVYVLITEADIQDGEISDNLILDSSVRGTYSKNYRGNKKISLINELHIPLPWNNNITIVPFLDSNVIGFGYNTLRVLIGGGIGLHWYNKFQDPLIIEIAFGKGIMLNFRKRF
ncbi:hypothetical protein ES703_49624 [subsurface metagenome]